MVSGRHNPLCARQTVSRPNTRATGENASCGNVEAPDRLSGEVPELR